MCSPLAYTHLESQVPVIRSRIVYGDSSKDNHSPGRQLLTIYLGSAWSNLSLHFFYISL